MDIENLDWYYEDCVIGGPGSFVVPIKGRENFKEAIRAKLIREVTGRTPSARLGLRQTKSRASSARSMKNSGRIAGAVSPDFRD